MAGGENNETVLQAIPVTVAAAEAEAAPPRRFRFTVPRIVDYLIVATFIYFVF